MAITEVTLGLFLTESGIILAMLIAAIGSRNPTKSLLISIAISFVGCPLLLSILYIQLSVFVTATDWFMVGAGRYATLVNPYTVMMGGCWFGGALGLYAGKSWEAEGNRSCLNCLIIPLGLVTLLTMVLFILP